MRYTVALRRLLLVVLLFISNTAYSQCIGVSYYYQGVWNGWDGTEWSKYGLYGSKYGLRVYEQRKRPADFFFRFWFTDYTVPEKKDIKKHYKTKTKWIYKGYVEYYVCDVYPTFEDCLRELRRPLYKEDTEWPSYQEKLSVIKANKIRKTGSFTPIGYKKVTKPAEIWILPYKKYPKVYNIWFDNVGYAIDLGITDEYFGK